MSRMPGDKTPPSRGEHDAKTLAMILETIRGLRFGVVTIFVHDGVVMQVDRTERFRFATRREISGEGDGI